MGEREKGRRGEAETKTAVGVIRCGGSCSTEIACFSVGPRNRVGKLSREIVALMSNAKHILAPGSLALANWDAAPAEHFLNIFR